MAFDEIVQYVMSVLNLTADEARDRIGIYVNQRYKKITSSIGLITSRRQISTITVDPSDTTTYPSLPELTIQGYEKINKVTTTGNGGTNEGITILRERTYDELTSYPPMGAAPRNWAVKRMGPGVVTIVVDGTPTTTYPLSFEGYAIAETLADDIEPFLPTDFHDILIEGARADELMKMEKYELAAVHENKYETRLGNLRYFISISIYKDVAQGIDKPDFWWQPWFCRNQISLNG